MGLMKWRRKKYMNKLLIDKDNLLTLNDEKVNLEIKVSNLKIIVFGNVNITDFSNNDDLNLEIELKDGSKLLYNKYNQQLNKYHLDVTLNNDSFLEYNQSLLTKKKSEITINTLIKGNENKCQINCYGVSDDDGQITIEATGDVKKKIKNNEMLENLRILMLNDAENIIIPNLLVASNEVSVNHNATISSVDPNYLMALESKGLSKEEASKLLVNGFIKHNLKVDEEMIDLINY